jgi:bifunctional non-homologous end joining protein LigD
MAASRRPASTVNFSNLDKVFFPAARFTKGDLIKYYIDVAPVLLPHFRQRPVTLIRFPDGVRGEKFYEKNAPGHAPEWVPTTDVPRSEGGVIHYIMINDARTLAWCANLAAIELHPFLHRARDIQRPTHLAFDLDPGEGADLQTCIEVGFLLREVLTGLKLTAFPKVTGSKGLQLYVPLNTPVTYDVATPFAKAIAELLHRNHPDLIVSDMSKALRAGKVFIDWSQNHEKKTTVGVYSVRGKRDEPFVSTPVTWDELKRVGKSGRIASLFFSPAAALRRVEKHGDLFAPVLTLKQQLPRGFTADAAGGKAPASLRRYAAKRDFTKTAEPAPVPQRSRQGSRRRFVIQKHAASHLHYDFRLEMDDVLKSWAIPKGVPLEPDVKRSAFATEDHPLEYLSFEGTIPAGQYGGGTVMVWDIGTYDIIDGNYWKGDLKLFLSGRKLRGEWHIFRIKGESEDKPVWLIRKAGKDALELNAREKDRSATSGRTMEEIAADKSAIWESNRKDDAVPAAAAPRRKQRAPAATMPEPAFVEPMTARPIKELPAGDEWLYEIKLDGYRGLGLKHGDRVQLLSRKEKDLAREFPAVTEALRGVAADSFLIDGEIVALDADGRPSFQLLQNRGGEQGAIVYYAFDLLTLEGEDWRQRPLVERKAKLEKLIAGSNVRMSVSFDGPADRLVAEVRKQKLEGVIAKRRDSKYQPRRAAASWVKFKLSPAQEFVVGGYKRGTPMDSLVVGYYEGNRLLCAGKVRQGLNPRLRRELAELLRPLEADVCPFANLPNSRKSHWGEGITAEQMKEIQWVMPRVVVQVSFAEWTRGGSLRHGTYEGLRPDKEHRDVVREGAAGPA